MIGYINYGVLISEKPPYRMEQTNSQLKRCFRIVVVESPKQSRQDLTRSAALQLLTTEEARLDSSKPAKFKRHKPWFQRKIHLSVSQVLEALVKTRVTRKIRLLNQIVYDDEAMEATKFLTLEEYIQSDAIYCNLTLQIQWLSQLEDMPIAMALNPFKYYVNEVAKRGECFNLSQTPSYLSTEIEEYFKTDLHFQKQKAHQKLCHLILNSNLLINASNQSYAQLEAIRVKLCQYLCKRHKVEDKKGTVQKIVNHYIRTRAGMLLSGE